MSPLIIAGIKKLNLGKLLLMLATFCVVFAGCFGYLIGCFEIQSIKAATVSVTMGSVASVAVTYSAYGRASVYIFGLKLFHGIGRVLFLFSATWICIAPALQNLLSNIGIHRQFLLCVTEKNGSGSTQFDAMVASVHFIGATLHWCVLAALVIVYLSCLWELIIYSQKFRDNRSSTKWDNILSTLPVILMSSGVTGAGVIYTFDFLFYSMSFAAELGSNCTLPAPDHVSTTRLFILFGSYAICFLISFLQCFFNSLLKSIMSKFFEDSEVERTAIKLKPVIRKDKETKRKDSGRKSLFSESGKPNADFVNVRVHATSRSRLEELEAEVKRKQRINNLEQSKELS